ncbi:bifunctional 2',3'-cyclic-nucleotide 2'-phosphodiesterase/3'-nucleotidase [Halanaerobium saccharolyticum]|uniref:bifunctional 2',3'-cyclic-nucleotide 2'-phosphodiesterase/3'-nucleotidase n=1 Tax=Halanaerobium saccharolyticum TaxID=43595 RepID=UPI000DB99E6D
MLKGRKVFFSLFLTFILIFALSSVLMAAETLSILSTSDVHQYLVPYDYMEDQVDETIGFSKIYTLIEEERNNNPNTLLLDNGDLIQGSLIGLYEYQIEPITEGETQTIIKAYNHAGYDAATIGNHELQDYSLDYLEKAMAGADFPFLSANIMLAENEDEFYTDPYTIITKNINGKDLRIGVVGFVPPQSMRWGKDHLEGNVVIKDIMEQAEEVIPELAQQTDIVVVLSHSGISDAPVDSYDARENASYYIAQMDEVDALITGHHHGTFPDDYADLEGVNAEEATIFGVPTVMPGSWGSALGIIDLEIAENKGSWEVVGHQVRHRVVDEDVESHPEIEEIAQDVHENVIEYVRTPIGDTERDITSYLARVMDSSVTQIINDAQLWWAEDEFAEGEYSDLPILSAAAPFRAGREDADYFTEVMAGGVTIGDVTDIYIYDNQIRVMHLNGEQIIEWLERSAENFNRIDPDSESTQELLNPEFSAYNFDVIDGIEYEIDVTNEVGERIVNAEYQGEALNEDMEFLVVTNDYRAGGGGDFPPAVEEDPVYAPSGVVNREIIMDYIEVQGTINPAPDYNWSISSFDPAGEVTFRSHPEAMDYIEEYEIPNISFIETDENGMGVYRLDVSNLDN